jgi:galactokinase
VRAPGRANLMGEHTDYNDGFVLPVALDLATYAIGRKAPSAVRLGSADDPHAVSIDLEDPGLPDAGWGRYIAAVVLALRDAHVPLAGFDGWIESDVPIGAGLASSAALEVATAWAIAGEEVPPVRLAEICREAENRYVGVSCGIMDQLVSAAARAGHAALIDCRDDSITHVPFPDGVCVLIIDSGVSRSLIRSSFNQRVRECRSAARALGKESLRDVSLDDIGSARGRVDDPLLKRARHVVSENERTVELARALPTSDLSLIGGLFRASHRSLRDDFEASTAEIDRLVEIAAGRDEVLGARLTGGGWGGCTVNLVERDADLPEVAAEIAATYERDTKRTARWWLSDAGGGAERLL